MARGKWWEYLIPGHNVGLMVGDVYDSITGNSEKNAGTGVFGTRKNDSNSYQYAQSNDRVTTAKNNLDYWKGQQPEDTTGQYDSQISGTQSQLDKMNRDGFSYDYTKDAAYQQYKNQYTRGAELASENAAANASARSGGYGNSWGTSSGQTAYQSTMNGLSDVADSLYSQAYNEYATKKSDLGNRLSSLQQQKQLAINDYNTKLNNYHGQLNNANTEYANAVAAAQQKDANNTNFWGNVLQVGAQLAGPLIVKMMTGGLLWRPVWGPATEDRKKGTLCYLIPYGERTRRNRKSGNGMPTTRRTM